MDTIYLNLGNERLRVFFLQFYCNGIGYDVNSFEMYLLTLGTQVFHLKTAMLGES